LRSGFTLAELLAVVAILAILAGVAIPSYMAIVNSSRYKVAKTECKKFAAMLKNYATANTEQNPGLDGYPAASGDMSILVSVGMLSQPPASPWQTPYFFELAQNPNSGGYEPIVYCFSAGNERIDSTQQ
jgi:prepilin-type N-terminal cleavage/methylation domain-containing protein